ncbi:MAG: SIMPL domain-containing protein [Candidatus Staskawiczbacteria bacterium]|jgi:hypothetical protein
MEQDTKNLLSKTFMLAQVLVVGILVFLVGQMIYHSQLLDIQNQNQITVSGEGKVYVKPDIAVVSIGVTTQDATVAEVTKTGTTKMNTIIDAMKALKIDQKDIKSTNYSLTPVYEDSTVYTPVPMMYPAPDIAVSRTSTTTIKGYRLEQSIEVKIRDFTKIGDALDQATKSGANTVGNLQFTIDNPEQFREQARAEAIKKAKNNAKNLAKESGISLGKIINVYENYNPYPVMYSDASKGMGVAESAPVPTIEPGQQEINVIINLTYKIK